MATRYYIPPSGSPPISPAFLSPALWESIATAIRVPLLAAKNGLAVVSTSGAGTGTAGHDVALVMGVSPLLAPQTITGNVRAVANVRENATGLDARSRWVIRACRPDGTYLADLINSVDSAGLVSEWPSGGADGIRRFPQAYTGTGEPITNGTIAESFHVVVEMGFRHHGALTNTARIYLGTVDADLGETEGTAGTAGTPWVEFTTTLVLGIVPNAPTGVTVGTVGNTQVGLSWTAPSANGGPAVDHYHVYANGSTFVGQFSGTSGTITGLTNGTSYTFQVYAHNVMGYGPASSASGAAVPHGMIRSFGVVI